LDVDVEPQASPSPTGKAADLLDDVLAIGLRPNDSIVSKYWPNILLPSMRNGGVLNPLIGYPTRQKEGSAVIWKQVTQTSHSASEEETLAAADPASGSKQ
jgi:hypothetical protein